MLEKWQQWLTENYINDVLKELGNSNDEILKEITLNKLSEDYGLSMSVLKEKLADVKPDVQVVETPKKEVKKEEKRDSYTISADNILYYII